MTGLKINCTLFREFRGISISQRAVGNLKESANIVESDD